MKKLKTIFKKLLLPLLVIGSVLFAVSYFFGPRSKKWRHANGEIVNFNDYVVRWPLLPWAKTVSVDYTENGKQLHLDGVIEGNRINWGNGVATWYY